MDTQMEQILDMQRQSWNNTAAGYKKWDSLMTAFLADITDEMIRLLGLKDNDTVLDIASGSGDPGLTIAAKVKNGKVVIADLAENMLEMARENASAKGVANFETAVCDVCALPFEDKMFDNAACRLGFMFFPDMQLAANEMVRVIKPGGRVVAAVWSAPDKNLQVTAMMGVIGKYFPMQPPPPGAPGMFRCAKPGLLGGIFSTAGLKNIAEKEISGKFIYDSKDTYWNFMNDIAAPVVNALGKVDDTTRAKVKNDLYELLGQKEQDGKIQLDYSILVISGEK